METCNEWRPGYDTDQLPISEVITDLPRSYHNIVLTDYVEATQPKLSTMFFFRFLVFFPFSFCLAFLRARSALFHYTMVHNSRTGLFNHRSLIFYRMILRTSKYIRTDRYSLGMAGIVCKTNVTVPHNIYDNMHRKTRKTSSKFWRSVALTQRTLSTLHHAPWSSPTRRYCDW